MKPLTLGNRVALIIALSSILTVAVILVTAYRQLGRDFEEVLTQRQALEARTLATQVDQSLLLRLNSLQAFASQLSDGEELRPKPELEETLGRQQYLKKLFPAGLIIMNENAVAVAESSYVSGRLGTSYADRPHFQRVKQTRQPVISRPLIGRKSGIALLSFLAPIETDAGDFLGYAGGILALNDTDFIPDLGHTTDNPDAGFVHILDTRHFYLLDSSTPHDGLQDLPPPGEDPIIDAALSGIPSGLVTDARGKKWVYATRYLKRIGWQFLKAVPYEQATAPAWRSFSTFLLISIPGTILLVACGLLAARATTTPLEGMTRRINAMVHSGDRVYRLRQEGAPEMRSLATAFNRLMSEREAADELKDHFMSAISHELRTPLTSMNGALRLLQSGTAGELPQQGKAMIDVAQRNGKRLELLINDLLDFNKARSGKMALDIQPVEVKQIADDALACLETTVQNSGVEIQNRIGPGIRVHADMHRLRQILDNFLSNAIKFSPPGSTVTVTGSYYGNDRVRIVVSDQGPGVPDNFKDQLFERFTQAENGTKRSIEGTGLGLSICKELASLMDGNIGHYNDGGAHFWLELPGHR